MKKPGCRVVIGMCALLVMSFACTCLAAEQKLLPSTPGLYFGEGLAASEGFLFVGSEQGYSPASSNNSNGYVDIYARQASGWVYRSTITAFDYGPFAPNGSSRFGNAVGVDGDWMAVAGHVASSNIETVYVYQRINGSWIGIQRFDRVDQPIGAALSVNELVAVHSSHILVAVKDFDGVGNVLNSRVLEYELQGGSFVSLGELGRPLQQTGDSFGQALAFVGDRLVVSAPQYVDQTGKRGIVFTYVFNGGQWVHLSLLQPDSASQLKFGLGLAGCLNGGQLAVAESNDLGSAGSQVGFIATYTPTEIGWTEGLPVQSSDASPPTAFGSSIACEGNVLTAAAAGANLAYRFSFAQGTWQQSDAFASSDPGNAGFGGPIVVSARDVVVSDMFQGSPTPTGAVYAFNDDTIFADGFE